LSRLGKRKVCRRYGHREKKEGVTHPASRNEKSEQPVGVLEKKKKGEVETIFGKKKEKKESYGCRTTVRNALLLQHLDKRRNLSYLVKGEGGPRGAFQGPGIFEGKAVTTFSKKKEERASPPAGKASPPCVSKKKEGGDEKTEFMKERGWKARFELRHQKEEKKHFPWMFM